MNNYTKIKESLEKFTHNLNFISQSDKEQMMKFSQNALYDYANACNKKSKLIIKSLTVNEASLLMWSQSLVIMSNIARFNNDPKIYDDYNNQMFEIFTNYSMDERFFDTSRIKREIAVYGRAEIEYDVNLGTTFCNTASLIALFTIHAADISDNQSEGMKYMQDYLSTNYLELQFMVAFTKFEFIPACN